MVAENKIQKPIDLGSRKVRDPERYPNIIVPIENKAKLIFVADMNRMIVDLTKKMVSLKK